jgi:foldase protein PrsA
LLKYLIPAIALAISATAPAQVDVNRVVATVNGEEIRGAEYYRYLEYMDLKDPYSRFRNMMMNFPAGFLAIDQLITNRLMLQLAKAKSALPSEPELNAELQGYVADSPETVKNWKASGRTDAELRERVRYDFAVFKLQTLGINVADGEIDKHYRENTAQFTTPKQYKLKVIVALDAATKDKVDQELKAGKPFADVARAFSDDISRVEGGDQPPASLGSMPEAIAKAVGATKIGQTSEWVTLKEQSLKFFLVDVTAEKVRPLDALLRRQIRRSLMLDRGRVKNDVGKVLGEYRLKAKVDIKQSEFAQIYTKLMQVQSTAPGGGG